MSNSNQPLQKILVVDDEELLLSLMRRALSGLYDVTVASSGDEALRILADPGCVIRVVLMDLTMPGMGGTPLLAHMRHRHPELLLVVMSGLPLDSAISLLRGVTPDAYLRKPVTIVQLTSTLSQVLAV